MVETDSGSGRLTQTELQTIRQWGEQLRAEPRLTLWGSDDPRTSELRAFCAVLTEFAPQVRVTERMESRNGLPALAPGRYVIYRGVPLGTELAAFLGVLAEFADVAVDDHPMPDAFRLKLYVGQQCPHCPRVFSTLAPIARRLEVGLDVVDATLFEETATADRAGAVPTLIVDGRVRVVGSVAAHDVEPLLTNPHALRPSSLRLLLENGNAGAIAALIREQGGAFVGLVDLLCDATFSVRLGAMAVIEQIADGRPELAAQLADPLWEQFDQVSDEVQGDLSYLFGKMRDPRLVPRLRAVVDGEYDSEVKEAARDALDELEQGSPHRSSKR